MAYEYDWLFKKFKTLNEAKDFALKLRKDGWSVRPYATDCLDLVVNENGNKRYEKRYGVVAIDKRKNFYYLKKKL